MAQELALEKMWDLWLVVPRAILFSAISFYYYFFFWGGGGGGGAYLFLIYVNDMESAVDCDLLLYADDSALLIRGKNIIDIEQKLSEELTKLNVWLIDNKLSLHLGRQSLSYLPQIGS